MRSRQRARLCGPFVLGLRTTPVGEVILSLPVKTGPQARFMLSDSELFQLLLQLLQHAFVFVDLGFTLLDGFFQFFLFGHDVSPLIASDRPGCG